MHRILYHGHRGSGVLAGASSHTPGWGPIRLSHARGLSVGSAKPSLHLPACPKTHLSQTCRLQVPAPHPPASRGQHSGRHLSPPRPRLCAPPLPAPEAPVPLASPIHMGFLALVTLPCPSPMTTDFHTHPHPHSPGRADPPQLPSHPGSVLTRPATLAPRVCPQHPPSAP